MCGGWGAYVQYVLAHNRTAKLFIFSLQYFETDDPELYTTKIKYIKENDVSDLELVFAEEVFSTSTNADPEVGKYAVCV